MAGEKFKFNFITNGEGILDADEPIGFDAADFTLKQESKRLGRDNSFAGNKKEFLLSINRNHHIEKFFYYYETFGWESEVQLIIEVNGFDNIIGDFEFFSAKTDLLETFSAQVILNKKQSLITKRHDVKIDLFSNIDLDDNEITPITTENLLIKAKPIKQNSRWETPEAFTQEMNVDAATLESDTEYFVLNPCVNLVKSNIENSLTFFQNYRAVETLGTAKAIKENDFILVEAVNNLKAITINITELDLFLDAYKNFGGDAYGDYEFELKYGSDWNTANSVIFFNGRLRDGDTYTDTNNYSHFIPFLNRGDKIWLYFYFKLRESGTGSASFSVDIAINSMNVEITSTSTSYNTIAPSVRLNDACAQTVNKISQMPISFPFAEPNGEMYNQRLVNGNLLRNILDKPFYLTMKDIEDWLPEIHGDYEVGTDSVYFGLYKDYYANLECGVFETIKYDDYEKMFNDKVAINQFNFKYSKYQSQKEEEVENTYDVVHGESEWLVPNIFVENKKEINIGFVRDAFLIAELQKKALTSSEDTATQDDDTVFIIDTIESVEDYVFQETDFIQHIYDTTNNRLELNNTGNFSFTLIGITVGTQFRILGGDANAGTYTVYEVTNRKLTLTGGGSVNNNGERITQFEYVVTREHAPYKIWGSEGFNIIDGLINSEDYANLRYSLKRNIVRFYNQYLATCNLWAKKAIKNTFYKNNPKATLSYDGLTTIEDESFIPSTPILSTFKHKVTLITDFSTYKTLENKIRTDRGFIRIADSQDFMLKLYPAEMTFVNSGDLGELTIIGEEKYETSLINITYSEIGYLIVNDFYTTSKIKYKDKGEKIYIFDENGRLLYKPTFWHKITINNANASTKQELIQWLTLIS